MSLTRSPKVALYSHDAAGLGHVRRNLLLAGCLGGAGWDVLVVTGTPEATAMPRPPRTDLVSLPALAKDGDGAYRARHLSMGLDEVSALRREILTSTLGAFAPDLLVVDRHARGFRGELEPALDALPRTRKVLGLRDVLDAPGPARREWRTAGTDDALGRWYDEIWCFGDPAVHHPLEAAGIVAPVPAVPLGYLVADRPAALPAPRPDGPYVVGMVGGGRDGSEVATAVLAARRPPGYQLVLVTGPQMADDRQRALARTAAGDPGAHVVAYTQDPVDLLRHAAAAVVMGGYNTVCEILASDTPALVVPRIQPRAEQLVRGRAMARRGLVDLLVPPLGGDAGPALATGIERWWPEAVARRAGDRAGTDLDGLARLHRRAEALREAALGAGPAPGPLALREVSHVVE